MKPTVKSFLALAGDKELTVHIARYKSDSADGYSDEKVFCGKSNDVPECYTNEKVTEWTTTDNSEIVLYNQKLRILERNDMAAIPHRTYGFSKKRDAKLCGRIAK